MRSHRALAFVLAFVALAAPAFAVFAVPARAAIQTKEIEYQQGETPLQGFLAWDDAAKGKRPGVLVVHEWWGHNQHARNQAMRLAKAGYVAFALDMYGKGKVAVHPNDAEAFMTEATKDPEVVAARFNTALDLLKQQPSVDAERIGAIGYCFGGAIVLGQARAGADLDAVASFHGALGTEHPAEKGAVKGRVLVMTGTADPFVPPAQVTALENEMKAAGANFEVIRYPGAKHGFTNPEAAKYGMEALKYDASADQKSWAAMLKMFKQALK